MKLLAIMIILTLPIFATEKWKTSYYRQVDLYPLGENGVGRLKGLLSRGYSQTDLQSRIQEKFFYLMPRLVEPVHAYVPGGYIILESGDGKILKIGQPDLSFELEIRFDGEGGFANKILRLDGVVVDQVDVISTKGQPRFAYSRLYGIHWFEGKWTWWDRVRLPFQIAAIRLRETPH